MPFLTQGKTNWKYILIVLILAVIVGGGILVWIKKQELPSAEFPKVKKPENKYLLDEKYCEKDEDCVSEMTIKKDCINAIAYQKLGSPVQQQMLTLLCKCLNNQCTAIEEETANWKTYRNEEYGFEIKYPKDWFFGEQKPEFGPGFVFSNYSLKGPEKVREDLQIIFLEIKKISITDWLNEFKEIKEKIKIERFHIMGIEIAEITSIDEITINSLRGYKVSARTPEINVGIFALGLKDKYVYSFAVAPLNPVTEKIFNQMLSTFRFLE